MIVRMELIFTILLNKGVPYDVRQAERAGFVDAVKDDFPFAADWQTAPIINLDGKSDGRFNLVGKCRIGVHKADAGLKRDG